MLLTGKALLLVCVPTAAEAQSPVVDLPQVGYRPVGGPPRPALRRTADLLEMLWTGQGTLTGPPPPP